MNKYEKEVEKQLLDNEKEILKELQKSYTEALANIKARISDLLNKSDELTPSQTYQLNFQRNLERQVSSIIDVLKNDINSNTNTYLTKMYEDSFIGTSYNLSKEYNFNTYLEINQTAVLEMVNKPIENMTFSERTNVNMNDFKKKIKSEISRGFATSRTYAEMSQSISLVAERSMYKAYRIARTEGLRVTSESKLDYAKKVKNKYGTDLVKQWDSTLDGKTRVEHQELDGQIKEIDECFECSGGKAKAPGLFGNPAMDCNCRCCLLQIPRWAIDHKFTKIDNEKTFNKNGEVNLIEGKDYNEYKKNYFKYLNNKNIDFSSLNLENLKDKQMKNDLIYLTKEYNTRLRSVSLHSRKEIKASGDVGLSGNMRLSTKQKTTYFHEFAHSITQTNLIKYDLGNDIDKLFWNEANKLFKEYKKEIRELSRNQPLKVYEIKISDYSLDNVDEFIAEGFARAKLDGTDALAKDYSFNNNILSPYAIKILNLIDKYYKK